LKKQKNVDTHQLVVAGYCFGGTSAIELARTGADLVGVISFHGGLDSPAPADGKNIKAKVLAFQGADDPYVAPADIAAFENEMKANKIDYQSVRYANTVHSFTEKGAGNDNSKGAAYNASSDARSFQASQNFLTEILKKNK
jgi:dienelactone hydrolase